MDRIPDEERLRIAGLLAEGAPVWRLHQEINRSRYAIRRAVVALQRPARREPKRSPLRLPLAEREEISQGLAAGQSLRRIARGLGRAPSTGVPGGGSQRRPGSLPGRAPLTGGRWGWRTVPSRPSLRGARGQPAGIALKDGLNRQGLSSRQTGRAVGTGCQLTSGQFARAAWPTSSRPWS
jgi:Helix-turn-helix domain